MTCLAIMIRSLRAGASLTAQARFRAHGTIKVYALVPAQAAQGEAMQTPIIRLTLPAR